MLAIKRALIYFSKEKLSKESIIITVRNLKLKNKKMGVVIDKAKINSPRNSPENCFAIIISNNQLLSAKDKLANNVNKEFLAKLLFTT